MQPFIFQTRMTRMTQINYNFYTPFSYGYWLWLLAWNLELETWNLEPIYPCHPRHLRLKI